MSGREYSMTEEERHAFRAYVVPDPVCVESHGDPDMSVSRKMREKLEANADRNSPKWEVAANAKKFNIAILDIPVLNSRSGTSNELMRYIISDIMLQIHACIDRGKREYIQKKVANGIRAAKEKGIKVGRRPKERPAEFEPLKEEWAKGEISSYKAAEKLGISHMTFLRWAREQS